MTEQSDRHGTTANFATVVNEVVAVAIGISLFEHHRFFASDALDQV
jgi:hypothetical protein